MKQFLISSMLLFSIHAFTQSGTVDQQFNNGTGLDGMIYSVFVRSNQSILVSGTQSLYNNQASTFLTSILPDGTLDNTFTFTSSGTDQVTTCFAEQADGKLLIGGIFSTINGQVKSKIARLQANGTVDLSFNPNGVGFGGAAINSVLIQSDSKILAGGDVNTYNGTAVPHMVRLTNTGELDPTFNFGLDNSYKVSKISAVSGGKYLVHGTDEFFNYSQKNYLTRLLANGSVDTTFHFSYNLRINDYVVLSDGKILVSYQNYQTSNQISGVMRLLPDGAIDPTFHFSMSGTPKIYNMHILADQRIVIDGFFNYNNAYKSLLILFPNGNIDTSFIPSFYIDDIYNSAIDQAGNIYVVGSFSQVNNIPKNKLAKINNCHLDIITEQVTTCQPYTWINGQTYYQSTDAYHSVPGANCDTTFHLSLVFKTNPTITVQNESLTSNQTNATYQWINCDDQTPIAGATQQSFTPTQNGSYAVEVSYNNCSITSPCETISTLTTEMLSQSNISVYPNPTRTNITVTVSDPQQIQIVNLLGKVLAEITLDEQNTTIQVANYPAGIYFIQLQDGSRFKFSKY